MLLALRYMRSARQDAFTNFLSLVAIGGIGLGVAALVLALAALSGFQQALKTEILARTPELEIELPAGDRGGEIADELRRHERILAVQMIATGKGWLLSGGRARPVEILGFEGVLPTIFPGAAGDQNGFYVADRLAAAWGIRPGELLEVASTRPTLTPLGPQPRVRRLRLTGTFTAGRMEKEDRVALPLEVARTLLVEPRTKLLLGTGDLSTALTLAGELRRGLPLGSRVRTWRDLNQGLFFALKMEKALMFVGVFLVVLVSGLGLIADLALVISSKRREIGMLLAMGARRHQILMAFTILGLLLAGVGGSAGLGIGAGAAWVLDAYELIRLPDETFFLDRVPFVLRMSDLGTVALLTVALALVCSWYAATRASRLNPIQALRR